MPRTSLAKVTSSRPTGAVSTPPRPSRRLQLQIGDAADLKKSPASISRRVLITLVSVLIGLNLFGLPYYLMPAAERVRTPLHPWLKSSGYIGQTAGILSLGVFLFLWLYPLRKKFRWLSWTGAIARWLDIHVLAALGLPLLVAIHASWHFTGVIGLGFWAMMVVWASGIVGRYLYTRIPRSKAGIELSIEEISVTRKTLLEQIAMRTGLDLAVVEATLDTGAGPMPRGLWPTLAAMLRDDLARRKAARRLKRLCKQSQPRGQRENKAAVREAMRLASREMSLTQQARMLDATHQLFRFWHVAHRPVAVTALIAVMIHVAVVVSLGSTWLW